jgi:rhamnogalacturonyl hydrolase YesR
MLHEARHDARLWNRAIELAAAIEALPHGVASARLHRPDLAGWEHEVWVDCMHLDGPFLARLGWLSADASWHALAVEALLSHARVLQDEVSGLFSHGFDDAVQRPNAVHWGRGQGWALLGLVDTIHWLPDKQDGRREMLERLAALVEALVATETASGEWPTVVDNPSTRFEVSVSAFVTLGLLRAMHFGLIDAAYRPVADRAWASVVAHLAANGDLQGVSGATPVGAAAAHYDAQPIGVFPWGQGAALLAAVERAGESPG